MHPAIARRGREDRIDEQSFNAEVWKSVKGEVSPVPQPQHNVIKAATSTGTPDGH